MPPKEKLNVLFVSSTKYSFPLTDETEKTKFELLGAKINQYIVGLTDGFLPEYHQYLGVNFYLIPRCNKLRIGGVLLLYPVILILYFIYLLYLLPVKKIRVITAQDPIFPGPVCATMKILFSIFGIRLYFLQEAFGEWIHAHVINLSIKSLKKPVEMLFTLLSTYSLNHADGLRAESDATLSLMKKYAKVVPSISFPRVNLELFSEIDVSPPKKGEGFRILFAGALVEHKGAHRLIKIVSKLTEYQPDTQLIICGDGPELKNLKQQVRKLALEKNVSFKGHLTQVGLKKEMISSDVLALPSLTEGLPRVIVEAMVLGKPVIGTDVGGVRDIIVDQVNGFIIQPGDDHRLEEALRILQKSLEKRQKMGEESKKIIESKGDLYTMKGYVRRYVQILNEIA